MGFPRRYQACGQLPKGDIMMQINDEARAAIQAYLAEVGKYLDGSSEQEQRDLLMQLESHIHEALEDRAEAKIVQLSDVQAVLSRMDPPESYGATTPRRARGLSRGKLALLISLGSLVLLATLLVTTRGRMSSGAFLVLVCAQAPAFVLGVLSRRDPFGKAAIFSSAAIVVVSLLCTS
jgi:hypothetical protein